MLGVVFIRQVIQSGTLGEHEGTKEQQMDCYVQAEDARSWSLHVRWGRLVLAPVGYVRSVSRRSGMIMTLSERQSAVIRHLGCWGFAATAAWRILEGLKGEVELSS